jgi:hypothetical protein
MRRCRHCQLKQGWYPPAVGGAAARCREVLGTLIGLPPSRERGQEGRLDRVKLTMPREVIAGLSGLTKGEGLGIEVLGHVRIINPAWLKADLQRTPQS